MIDSKRRLTAQDGTDVNTPTRVTPGGAPWAMASRGASPATSSKRRGSGERIVQWDGRTSGILGPKLKSQSRDGRSNSLQSERASERASRAPRPPGGGPDMYDPMYRGTTWPDG